MPIELRRNFNSNDPRHGMFGKGWNSSCDQALVQVVNVEGATNLLTGQKNYIMRLFNGRRYQFKEDEDFNIINPEGVFDKLTKEPNDTLKLTSPEGMTKTYDSMGQLIEQSDISGNTLTYTYDNGRLTRIDESNGPYLTFSYNALGYVSIVRDHTSREWLYDYDSEGHLLSVTNPLGGVKTYTYNDYNYHYDGQEYTQITSVVDESGVPVINVEYGDVNDWELHMVKTYTEGQNTYTYTYDIVLNERPTKITKVDSAGATREYIPSETGQWISDKNALGQTITAERNENGLITRLTDVNGHVTTSTYDEVGRLTGSTDARGTVAYTYKDNTSFPLEITSVSGRVNTFKYNNDNQLTEVKNPLGHTTVMDYYSKGDVKSIVDANGGTIRMTYNDLGQPTTVTDQLNRKMQYEYDNRGNLLSVTNPILAKTTYRYDALDRRTEVEDSLGNTTSYTYDAASRLLSVTIPNGASESYTYDGYGRIKTKTTFDGQTTTYQYNADNTLSAEQLPGSPTRTYTYDELKRVTRIDSGDEFSTYTYTDLGQIASITNNTGTVTYTYDTYGRMLSHTTNGETVNVTYNAENEVTSFSALGEVINYTYNLNGQVSQLTRGSITTEYTYTPLGQLSTKEQWPLSYGIGYDAVGGITQIATQKASYPYNNYRRDQYEFDQAGRIRSWNGISHSYDKVDRLTTINRNTHYESYRYDALGNREQEGITDTGGFVTYPFTNVYDQANRLLEDNWHTYQYDDRGNRTEKLNKETGQFERYTYNSLNQLVMYQRYAASTSHTPVRETTYKYDAVGRRIEKNDSDNGITKFYWNGSQLIGERSATDELTVYLAGTMKKGNDEYLYHYSHIGTPLALIDGSGETVWEADYAGFGATHSITGTVENNLRFPGQYYDVESGLHYNLFRDFDPYLGRYIQSDPIGLQGGINTYVYAVGNPLMYIDPLGLEVLLQTHPVALGFDHAKVTIIPDNQAAWANDPRFSNSLPDGRKYATLGAGPEGGDLVSNLNRSRDIDLSHNESSKACPIPAKFVTEDDLIRVILGADKKYRDNLDYEYFPQSFTDGFNSNSYVNGLLRSIGIGMPAPPNTPGFNKPVPSNAFR